jgi:zinc-ribbon domain
MFCPWCGSELPVGAAACPKCGRVATGGSAPETTSDFDQIVADAKRAAKDLASAAARLTERLAAGVEATAEDPKGSAHRVTRRVAKELEAARKEIEKALRDL